MRISLRTHIAIAVTLLLAAVVVITLTVAYHEMVEAMFYSIDRVVLRDTDVVRAGILDYSADEASMQEMLDELSDILSAPDRLRSTLYRVWVEGQPEDLLSSDPAPSSRRRALIDVPLPDDRGLSDNEPTTISADGVDYRALAIRVVHPGSKKVFYASVATPCDYALEEIHEFRNFTLILGGTVIAMSGLITGLIVHRSMRPLGDLASKIHDISHSNLDDPGIDVAELPSDLKPIGESVLAMLNRLEKSFRQQKRFTADAAHELRSPLAVAKSTIEATLAMPESQRDCTAMARSELEDLRRMERLIEQLLLLARLEADTSDCKNPVDVPDLLCQAVEEASLGHDKARVVVAQKPPSLAVQGNGEQLIRLLRNLIDNAIRHGPCGGQVTVAAGLSDEGQVVISVHDEGGKIPPELIGQLTDRFFRVDSSRARSTGGTGLGLAISDEIARRHGGSLTIESSAESGTSVRVRLPLYDRP